MQCFINLFNSSKLLSNNNCLHKLYAFLFEDKINSCSLSVVSSYSSSLLNIL